MSEVTVSTSTLVVVEQISLRKLACVNHSFRCAYRVTVLDMKVHGCTGFRMYRGTSLM